MSCDDLAIVVNNLSKRYLMYSNPQDRLKQALYSRWNRARGKEPPKFANEFWALRDVNFEVKKGETIGIVGRNGSGKSTLLQLICGTVSPTIGSVHTSGRVAALLELGAGFNMEFTGRENVYLNASLLGLTTEQIDDRFDRIAAFADIGPFIETAVKTYSSGMFARLAFSVAIHTEPEILIVDEILAVGDAAFQRRCLKKFYEIRDSGSTILFVSHDQYQVKSICQRAVYLEHGHQRLFAHASTVIDAYTVDMESAANAIATPATIANAEDSELFSTLEADTSQAEHSEHDAAVATDMIEAASQARAAAVAEPDRLYRIRNVVLCGTEDETPIDHITSGQDIRVIVDFEATTSSIPNEISFVFNLYRHDDLYLCGTTTIMEKMGVHAGVKSGRFSVIFPKFPLLNGKFKWRVAINDGGGFYVHAEAKDVCIFTVSDDFEAVGVINLQRHWEIQTNSPVEQSIFQEKNGATKL